MAFRLSTAQLTSVLQIIEERLNAENIAWIKLTGSTSKEPRVRLVERFQAGEVPVFLISLKAGGSGLNLTFADIVIHYDPGAVFCMDDAVEPAKSRNTNMAGESGLHKNEPIFDRDMLITISSALRVK